MREARGHEAAVSHLLEPDPAEGSSNASSAGCSPSAGYKTACSRILLGERLLLQAMGYFHLPNPQGTLRTAWIKEEQRFQ